MRLDGKKDIHPVKSTWTICIQSLKVFVPLPPKGNKKGRETNANMDVFRTS